jgi:hypothetical protein
MKAAELYGDALARHSWSSSAHKRHFQVLVEVVQALFSPLSLVESGPPLTRSPGKPLNPRREIDSGFPGATAITLAFE